ncbi:MAG: DUF4835 family protein [Ignavibacteriales bacterium]|nr:MAG: DUF4835 family protein [Ignavibacteriales bacterium]
MKLVITLFLLASSLIYSQELNCKVLINFESLPTANKELLVNFGNQLEDYINKTRFTTDAWEGDKIECTFNIFITSASSDVSYSAQIVVVSQRPVYNSTKNSAMLIINDNSWSFTYEKNQQIYPDQASFDPLRSLLDFYAYIIIGYDLDSYGKLGGSQLFSKAFDIVNLAATNRSATGWEKSSSSYSRWGLVEDMMNEKYRPFREAFFEYHYNGIDLFTQNKKAAQDKIVHLINVLESMRNKVDLNSVLIRTFFDAKNGEIIDYLKDYPDQNIFKVLKKIDPPHMSKYDEAIK